MEDARQAEAWKYYQKTEGKIWRLADEDGERVTVSLISGWWAVLSHTAKCVSVCLCVYFPVAVGDCPAVNRLLHKYTELHELV